MATDTRGLLGKAKDTITETLQGYAEMQDAYDAAFDNEKEPYPQDIAADIDHDADAIEDYDSLVELLGDTDYFVIDDPVRFYGDALRAQDDDDITGIMDDIKEYGGSGKQGWLFGFFALAEDYDTAAALIGEDSGQVEDDIAPLLDEYNALRKERYGLPETELDDDVEEQVQTATEILHPAIRAYGNGSDVVDTVQAVEDVESRAKAYVVERAMDAAMSEAESQMEGLFDAMEHELGTDQFALEPMGMLDADGTMHTDGSDAPADAAEYLAENDDAFTAYITVREVIDAIEDEDAYSEAMADRDLSAAAAHTAYDPDEFMDRFEAAEDARSDLVLNAMDVLDNDDVQVLEEELDQIYGDS